MGKDAINGKYGEVMKRSREWEIFEREKITFQVKNKRNINNIHNIYTLTKKYTQYQYFSNFKKIILH